ncbi:hypothetical protein BOW15_11045 [Solemya velum gill symbiont]|nr:hypothetical protein BOW15_11045 [Solemya velum gill symbiont]
MGHRKRRQTGHIKTTTIATIARFVGGFAFHKNHGDRDSCSQKLHKDFIVARYFLVDLPQFIEKHLFGKN